MVKRFILFVSVIVATAGIPAHAEQFRTFGDYTVHYSAFTTDILSASIAKAYKIQRSKNRVLLNISVLKKVMGTTGKPVKAIIEVSTTNLSEQLRQLKVKELAENDAIYYLAMTKVNDGEILKYTLTITPESEQEAYTFSFTQQFVTDY